MIRETDIQAALEARLASIEGLPRIVLENEDDDGTRPFVVVEHVILPPLDSTLNGDATRQRGYMQASVVSDQRQLSNWARRKAEDIRAAFPMADFLPVTGGEVSIHRPPHIMQGYPDGAEWRQPIQIFYEAR